MTLAERILQSLRQRPDGVLLRQDVVGLGSPSQVSAALRSLQESGLVQRFGLGIYGETQVVSSLGARQVAQRIFNRLGISAKITETRNGLRVNSQGARIERKLRIGDTPVSYDATKRRQKSAEPQNRFSTPTSRYVFRLARSAGVRYATTYADRWAESVTSLAGDDVRPDATEDALVALKRSGNISGPELVRLAVTHLREKKSA